MSGVWLYAGFVFMTEFVGLIDTAPDYTSQFTNTHAHTHALVFTDVFRGKNFCIKLFAKAKVNKLRFLWAVKWKGRTLSRLIWAYP
jgi:hypothetical protein